MFAPLRETLTRIDLLVGIQASVREEKKLLVENAKLKQDIEDLKKQLLDKEKKRGGKVKSLSRTDCSARSFRIIDCVPKGKFVTDTRLILQFTAGSIINTPGDTHHTRNWLHSHQS